MHDVRSRLADVACLGLANVACLRLARAACLAMAALAAGCATLPDASPYRDASVQLRSAVVATGHAVHGELADAAVAIGGEDQATLEKEAGRFAADWKARIAAADALVAYAQALADLTQAGSQGGDSVRTLAGSLAQLASGVGLALPAAGALATVTDTAAFVYAQVAAVRASRSLDEALAAAQPAVDEIAAKLGRDLDASAVLVQAAHGLQRNALVARHNDELGFVKGLERERRQLYAKGRLGRDDERRLKEIGELFESTRSWREPLEASFARLDQRLAAGRDAIAATKLAVFEWAAAHRALAAAVREGRTVRVDALLQATLEARELVRRLRAL